MDCLALPRKRSRGYLFPTGLAMLIQAAQVGSSSSLRLDPGGNTLGATTLAARFLRNPPPSISRPPQFHQSPRASFRPMTPEERAIGAHVPHCALLQPEGCLKAALLWPCSKDAALQLRVIETSAGLGESLLMGSGMDDSAPIDGLRENKRRHGYESNFCSRTPALASAGLHQGRAGGRRHARNRSGNRGR